MFQGWRDMFISSPNRSKREFVSVDARLDDLKKDTRSYEMLSRDDSGKTMNESVTPSVVTPISPTLARSQMGSPNMHQDYSSTSQSGNGHDGRRTPDFFGQTARYHAPARSFSSPRAPTSPQQATVTWDARETYAPASPRGASPQQEGRYVNPLGMNRI
jgi:hypothetical protein